jgi:hypothetical protein
MSELLLKSAAGAAAALETIDDDRVTLWSEEPSAPGSRFELIGELGSLRVKVHRCVRDGDRFRIAGRLIDATRRLRDQLSEALVGDADGRSDDHPVDHSGG